MRNVCYLAKITSAMYLKRSHCLSDNDYNIPDFMVLRRGWISSLKLTRKLRNLYDYKVYYNVLPICWRWNSILLNSITFVHVENRYVKTLRCYIIIEHKLLIIYYYVHSMISACINIVNLKLICINATQLNDVILSRAIN